MNNGNVNRQFTNIIGAFNSAFNPVGGDSWTSYAPTALQPALQISSNEKWHGGSIKPEVFNTLEKESQRIKQGTPSAFIDLSDAIHRTFGGTTRYESGKEYRYGGLDFHPNELFSL